MKAFFSLTQGHHWNLVDRKRMQEVLHSLRYGVKEEDIPYLRRALRQHAGSVVPLVVLVARGADRRADGGEVPGRRVRGSDDRGLPSRSGARIRGADHDQQARGHGAVPQAARSRARPRSARQRDRVVRAQRLDQQGRGDLRNGARRGARARRPHGGADRARPRRRLRGARSLSRWKSPSDRRSRPPA